MHTDKGLCENEQQISEESIASKFPIEMPEIWDYSPNIKITTKRLESSFETTKTQKTEQVTNKRYQHYTESFNRTSNIYKERIEKNFGVRGFYEFYTKASNFIKSTTNLNNYNLHTIG